MKAKKSTSRKQSLDGLIDASLALATCQPWSEITLQDIARDAKMTLPELHELIQDKFDILIALGRRIDKKTLENIGSMNLNDPNHDRLFEVLMVRFDVMNEHRTGLCALLKDLRRNPKDALLSFPLLCQSMGWMLEAAHIPVGEGVKGMARLLGLGTAFIRATHIWMDDETQDLSKTMAALDRILKQTENLGRILRI
jgi:AcrR family transcriptional regulator